MIDGTDDSLEMCWQVLNELPKITSFKTFEY